MLPTASHIPGVQTLLIFFPFVYVKYFLSFPLYPWPLTNHLLSATSFLRLIDMHLLFWLCSWPNTSQREVRRLFLGEGGRLPGAAL